MKETLRQRIGVDVGRRVSAEEAVEWAAQNEVYYFDIQTDIAPNALESFDESRCSKIREGFEKHGLHLGLHTHKFRLLSIFTQFHIILYNLGNS